MSVLIKVLDGTPPSGQDMCKHCRYMIETRGEELKQHIRHCRMIGESVPFAVATCSDFQFHDEDDIREKLGRALWLDFDAKKGLLVGTGQYEPRVTVAKFLSGSPKPARKRMVI